MCVCAEGKQVTSLLRIRFPRTEPGEKLFDYAQWKHFACLDLEKEMGLSGSMSQDSGRKHWRWDEHSFLLSVLCSRRRCRQCPSWRMRAVLTTGGHHSIGGFIFLSHCDSSQPSCKGCSSVLLLLGWTPDQKQLGKKRVIWLALQVTIHPWGKPGQELKTGTWEPWKKVACWIVLCWRSYTDLGSPS